MIFDRDIDPMIFDRDIGKKKKIYLILIKCGLFCKSAIFFILSQVETLTNRLVQSGNLRGGKSWKLQMK